MLKGPVLGQVKTPDFGPLLEGIENRLFWDLGVRVEVKRCERNRR
jgi:hypothetical protein